MSASIWKSSRIDLLQIDTVCGRTCSTESSHNCRKGLCSLCGQHPILPIISVEERRCFFLSKFQPSFMLEVKCIVYSILSFPNSSAVRRPKGTCITVPYYTRGRRKFPFNFLHTCSAPDFGFFYVKNNTFYLSWSSRAYRLNEGPFQLLNSFTNVSDIYYEVCAPKLVKKKDERFC